MDDYDGWWVDGTGFDSGGWFSSLFFRGNGEGQGLVSPGYTLGGGSGSGTGNSEGNGLSWTVHTYPYRGL